MAVLALGLAAGVCLAGCGNGLEVAGPSPTSSQQVVVPSPPGASSTAPSSAPQSTTSVAAPPPGAPSAQPTQGGGTESAPPPSTPSAAPTSSDSIDKCGLADLTVTLRSPAGNGAAGSQYVLLGFRNKSSQPCTIYGYPGVSFVGHQNGTQLGKPALRATSRTAAEVLLRPGVSRSALLQIAEAGNFDPEKCQPTTSDGFRVYPPDSFTAAYVPFKASACQSKKVAQLTVYPVGANS